jgi:hypothetical protein
MVLRLSDVPTGFELTKGRYISNREATAGNPSHPDYGRMGRLNGYEATYDKAGGIFGMLEVVSTASIYRTAAGAHTSFQAGSVGVESSRSPRFHRLSVGDVLGAESRLYKTTTKQNGTSVVVYAVVWRAGTVNSSILAAGIAGTVDPSDIVALAKKQVRRIANR